MDYVLIDTSYIIFFKIHSTLTWFKMSNTEFSDELFIEKFQNGMEKLLIQLKKKFKFEYHRCFFTKDTPRSTIWRNKIYKEYKDNRVTQNKELVDKAFPYFWSNIMPLLETKYNVKSLAVNGAEADDIVASVKNYLREEKPSSKIMIITNDHDFIQLHDSKTTIYNLKNHDITSKYDDFILKNFIKYKVIKGDSSDNIPSIGKGIGNKRIRDLLVGNNLVEYLERNPASKIQYELNDKLMNFKHIPSELVKNSVEEFKKKMI